MQATSGTLGFIGLSTWALVAIGGSNVIGFLILFEKELKSPVEFWLILLGPWKLPWFWILTFGCPFTPIDKLFWLVFGCDWKLFDKLLDCDWKLFGQVFDFNCKLF